MIIHVYGKKGCKLCKSATKKVEHFLERWEVSDEHDVIFMDMESDESAAAEGDFFEVFDIPSVLVMKDDWEVAARWDGQAPPSSELQAVVADSEDQNAAA
ncbi:MAG: hypothetical protein ACLFWL_00355 [Candidatus Brocadiia bacterium]